MSKWEFVALSEVCNIEKGKTGLMKAEPGEYPLVATGQERRTCNTYQFDAKAVCIPLVSSTGHGHASLKYVHYQEGKFALGTILAAVIPKDENVLNAQFLHLYLSRLKDELLVPLMTGAANVTLTVTKLKTVKVPLPPIEEQLRIVSLFNRMDNEQKELVEEIEHQQTLLKKLRQSILQEAIEGKLTADWRATHPDVEPASVLLEKIRAEKERLVKEKKIKKQKPLPPIEEGEVPFEIPESWEWCRLGDLLYATAGGKSPKCENRRAENNEWGVIKTTAIQNMRFIENENKVLPKSFQVLDQYIIHENDLIITRAGPINRVGIVCEVKKLSKKLILSDKTIRMQHNKDFILPSFMQYVLNSKSIKLKMQKYMTGMADSQVNISQDNMKKFLVLLAPLEEQKEIVKKIENLFTLCDALEAQIDQSKTNSEALMQAVLREAFEPDHGMKKIGDDEKAMTAMSYIIDNIESEKLGRVKLQKILYMYSAVNNEYFGFNYQNKHAMGPHDKVGMDEIEVKLEKEKWFKKVRMGEGERSRFDYVPLSSKNDYKKLLSKLPNKKELDRIINLMRPLDLARSEVIATLYAVWKEETNLFGEVGDSIIIAKAKEWHQNKKKYTNDHWKWGMKWLRDNGFIE